MEDLFCSAYTCSDVCCCYLGVCQMEDGILYFLKKLYVVVVEIRLRKRVLFSQNHCWMKSTENKGVVICMYLNFQSFNNFIFYLTSSTEPFIATVYQKLISSMRNFMSHWQPNRMYWATLICIWTTVAWWASCWFCCVIRLHLRIVATSGDDCCLCFARCLLHKWQKTMVLW